MGHSASFVSAFMCIYLDYSYPYDRDIHVSDIAVDLYSALPSLSQLGVAQVLLVVLPLIVVFY